MQDSIWQNVLIVENKDSLFIVENRSSKATVENILENSITAGLIEESSKNELDLEFQQTSSQSSFLELSNSESLLESEMIPTVDQNLLDSLENGEFFGEFHEKNQEILSNEPNSYLALCGIEPATSLIDIEKNSGTPDSSTNCEVQKRTKNYCKFCDFDFKSTKQCRNHKCPYLSKKNFICRICEKELSKKSFNYHLATHEPEKSKVKCKTCFKDFSNSKLLELHQTIHTKNKPHKCEHCPANFHNRQQLIRHWGVHGIPPPIYKCDICSKSFSYKNYLTLHLNTHSKNPRFICMSCPGGRVFERNDYLKEHYQTAHSKEKNYCCSTCGKFFSLKKYLRRHTKIHQSADRSKFSCQICQKKLSGRKQYENHILLHSGQRDHICEKCGKSFITKSALTNHMYKHNPDLPRPAKHKIFKCFLCPNVQYIHKSQLERHMCIHSGMKPEMFPCKICGKELSQKYYLNQHMLAKHGDELRHFCEACSKGYFSSQQLKRHKKSCLEIIKQRMELNNSMIELQQEQQVQVLTSDQILRNDQIFLQT